MPKESTSTGIKDSIRISVPKRYTVFIHNDDFTTMEFVVEILVQIFHKPVGEAYDIMMRVHNSGRGKVGSYTYDIAHTKVKKAERLARSNGYPLRLTLEPEK